MDETPVLQVDEDGTKTWRLNGQLHREDGPAIERVSGRNEWYVRGLLHREDGPAREWPGERKEWYRNGQRHREDGPAFEGGKKSWWLRGEKVTQAEVEALAGSSS